MCVHLTEFFNFVCSLHNDIERKGKSAVPKRASIKCGCEYRVCLAQTRREPNAPWVITACNLDHTNGCHPTKSTHLACTQRGKKQWAPVLDALVNQIGEVPTSAVTQKVLLSDAAFGGKWLNGNKINLTFVMCGWHFREV